MSIIQFKKSDLLKLDAVNARFYEYLAKMNSIIVTLFVCLTFVSFAIAERRSKYIYGYRYDLFI